MDHVGLVSRRDYMDSDIQNVSKNPRYRILEIKGERFVLDMWGSFWKIVFPFLFWMFPNKIYKLEDPNVVEKLKEHKVAEQHTKIGVAGTLLSGGIAVFFGNLLTPLLNKFDAQGTKLINLSVIAITITIVFLLFFYITRVCKKRLYKIVNIEQLSCSKIRIRARSLRHFFQVLLYYFLFLTFTVFLFGGFFEIPNVIILLLAAVCLFFVLISSLLTVIGNKTVVNFKEPNT